MARRGGGRRWLAAIVIVPVAAGAWVVSDRAAAPVKAALAVAPDLNRIVYPKDQLPAFTLPGGERRPIRSLLVVPGAMRYGRFVWNEDGAPPGPVWVRVDLPRQTLSVFRGGHEIGSAVILYGADEKPTPLGRFPILARLKDHRSSLYDAPMPYTLRLTGDGVAIHGSDVRRGAATHGCIGVPTAFAAKLFAVIERGDEVFIVGKQQV